MTTTFLTKNIAVENETKIALGDGDELLLLGELLVLKSVTFHRELTLLGARRLLASKLRARSGRSRREG